MTNREFFKVLFVLNFLSQSNYFLLFKPGKLRLMFDCQFKNRGCKLVSLLKDKCQL